MWKSKGLTAFLLPPPPRHEKSTPKGAKFVVGGGGLLRGKPLRAAYGGANWLV